MDQDLQPENQEHLMKQIEKVADQAYHKGLEPSDFAKASCLNITSEEWETLAEMGFGLEKPIDTKHICNVLTEEQLACLCYERRGKNPSYLWYREWIAKGLDVQPEWLPDGLVDAQLTLSLEQSHGRRSYKNFLRRLEREIKCQRKRDPPPIPTKFHKKPVTLRFE